MKYLWSFSLFLLLNSVLSAQEAATGRTTPVLSLNGNFQVGIPLEDFRDNVDKPGFGGGFSLLVPLGQSPLAAGLDLGIMGYDRETAEYRVRVGGFNKDYELSTSTNIFLGHAMLRIQPFPHSLISPYLDGMAGFKNLFTSSSLTDLDLNEAVNSGTDESDWAFSYGGALGLQIHFNQTRNFSLDLRCAYLPGNNATYLVRVSDPVVGIDYEDPLDAFEKKNSPTNMLLPQIGLTYKFWNRPAPAEPTDDH